MFRHTGHTATGFSLQRTGACLQHQPSVYFRNSSPTSATCCWGPSVCPAVGVSLIKFWPFVGGL